MTNSDDANGIIILPVDAVVNVNVTKNNSPADGNTVNTAIASLDNDGDYLDGIVYTFEITEGNATFVITGNKTIDVKANPAMVATANFTDSTVETGKIIAYPTVNNKLVDETSYTFSAVALPLLTLSVEHDNAPADLKDFNEVDAKLTHNGGQPFSGQDLIFTLPANGTATFIDGPTQSRQKTDGQGNATVKIIDSNNTGDYVTVTCTLESDANISKNIQVQFSAPDIKPTQPIINAFDVTGQVILGISNDGTPCVVKAEITPAANSPLTYCYIIFSGYESSGLVSNRVHISGVNATSGANSSPTFISERIQLGAVKYSYNVNIHYMGSEAGSTRIQAQLLHDADQQVFATSNPNALVSFEKVPPPPPSPPPLCWPVEVRCSNSEWQFDPADPTSNNYHWCEIIIFPNQVPDKIFTIRITNDTSKYTLGDIVAGMGSTLSCFSSQPVFVGIYKNQPNDTGAALEITCSSRGVVWRGIVYPRSSNLTLTN